MNITSGDLPALHNAASSASGSAQKRYLALFIADLIFLIVGATLSAISVGTSAYMSLLAVLGGISFIISLVLTGAIRFGRYEKDWYGGRAIAESVKTLAWRYMTCAEPYLISLTAKEADQKLADDLGLVLSQRKYLSGALDGKLSDKAQISDRMREIRNLNTTARRDFYIKARIEEQRTWYGQKAHVNQRKEEVWFIAIMCAQIGAGAAAFCLVRWPEFPLNLAGIFSTLATAFIAWLQVKRHQELAQSYNLAAQELGLIAIKAHHVDTDDELSVFVADAENAISREHTMWIARRDQA
jgi:hypothetical protein